MAPDSINLRPSQEQILAYTHGKMGISAVPGSGKTWTLSLLASQLIERGGLMDNQELLIVTLVNSAVDNFKQRIDAFVQGHGLIPIGYRVRTLHGLAHDIVRERPDLVGLEDKFQIIDEQEAASIRNAAARAWMQSHPEQLMDYINPGLDEDKAAWVRREKLPELVESIAQNVVAYAKDCQLTPERLRARIDQLPVALPLAEMGCEIYTDYQRGLAYRGAVDFADLIRLALLALQSDAFFLERLQQKWPYILEDEAQDSSQLQEQILSLLAGAQGNWVRVGDPNQAIYETFTTANPRYLHEFIDRSDVAARELPESGRSTRSIIRLANYLVDWTRQEHPLVEARDALVAPPYIEPTSAGDPQPNPADDPGKIALLRRKYLSHDEIKAVADSLARWLPDHPNETVAVLASTNDFIKKVVDYLEKQKIPVVDSLLRASLSTRHTTDNLAQILRFLLDARSADRLSRAFQVWRREDRESEEHLVRFASLARRLGKIACVEDYLWPTPDRDWLAGTELEDVDPVAFEWLVQFRDLARRWQAAVLLPIDQLVLTVAQDLFTDPVELALSHDLAVELRMQSRNNPSWRLPELVEELLQIAQNKRRHVGFSADDTGFDPEQHKGKVVVATMHKAKGLEWDRVYLMSVNNYDFPSGLPQDSFISEKWYIRDGLNLEAEAMAQIETTLSEDAYTWYQESVATRQARLDFVRERLRLLYVAITRAKKELVVTWNTGRNGNLQPAIPLVALQNFWIGQQTGGQV